ncbi:MAG: ribonuclease P protein component, partial [Proteobacteria bacterium]|nr:ribonuclease P protein component [Pseudomonadota bacterium]
PEAAPRQGPSAAHPVIIRAAATSTGERERTSDKFRSYRFLREARLRDEKAYSRVFSKARRSHDTLFTVLYRCGEHDGARLGLAVSKKNCRLAVGRNRIKRIVRESFRQHQHALRNLDVVVLNKPKTHEATNKALFESLENHWQRCQADTQDRAG